jgi:transcriptional regulator with XRE-family HTH domain
MLAVSGCHQFGRPATLGGGMVGAAIHCQPGPIGGSDQAGNADEHRPELDHQADGEQQRDQLHQSSLSPAANWSINAVGIRRIESGERRVTPDDLTALAVALGVSPITLLMPVADDQSDCVGITGFRGDLTAGQLWDWLKSDATLPETPELLRVLGPQFRLATFGAFAWPSWIHDRKRAENVAVLMDKLKELGVGGVGDNQ